MTDDQIRDLIIVGLFLTPIIFGGYIVISKSYNNYVSMAMEQLNDFINEQSENPKKVKFYSTGHPYTWCEISYDELLKKIKEDCWFIYSPIPVPKKSRFLLAYNTDRNALHIVLTTKKEFDWDSLKYYDEYVKNS